MKNITIVSAKQNKINKNQRLTRYLYKSVFTKDGRNIGRVVQIIFDMTEIKGFIVAKNLFMRRMFIGMEYVDKFTTNSVLLKINPVTLLKGMTVFDSEGKIVGKIKTVRRRNNSNTFDSVVIRKGIFRKEHIVNPNDMIIMKKNVKLRIEL